jgi:hypothetical protein
MTPLQMSKVWSVVSLFVLYYALNSYLVTQGGETIFGATLIMKSRVPAGFLAIPICSFLLLMASLIGTRHRPDARYRHSSGNRPDRSVRRRRQLCVIRALRRQRAH